MGVRYQRFIAATDVSAGCPWLGLRQRGKDWRVRRGGQVMMAEERPALAGRLAQGTVLGAEGYVFELERRGYIKAGAYVPEVVLDFPGAVSELHREFLRAGADVMVALTYYAHREKLRQLGRESDLEAMNRQAVRLARDAAGRLAARQIPTHFLVCSHVLTGS